MLYNPTWNKTPSIEGLIVWLETQDPATTYDWRRVGGCLICAYYNALGINNFSSVSRPLYGDMFGEREDRKRYYAVAERLPWTYGAALERARAIVGG